MVSNLLVVLCGERLRSQSSTPAPFTNRRDGGAQNAATNRFLRRAAADDDLRSLNGQIEWVLREALRQRGRVANDKTAPTPPRP